MTPNTVDEQTYFFTSHSLKQALFPQHKTQYGCKNKLVICTIRVLCGIPREISQFPENIEKVGFLVKISDVDAACLFNCSTRLDTISFELLKELLPHLIANKLWRAIKTLRMESWRLIFLHSNHFCIRL